MHGLEPEILRLVLLLGAVLSGNVLITYVFDRLGLPSLLAFILLGIALSWTNERWPWIGHTMMLELKFLARLGLVALLFKVGLDSDITGLIDQLSRAVWVWLGNVIVSVAAGYGTAAYLLNLDSISSLIVGVALSATSVGVTASIWEETDQLKSDSGELFVDVAEMDDLSAVVLMALLFMVIPELRSGNSLQFAALFKELSTFVLQAGLFVAFCLLFSTYLEKPISNFVSDIHPNTGPLLMMVGLGLLIAAFSVIMGFSLAIGALFAGIVFSRDPVMIRQEASFQILYDFFTPFFFLVIGLNVKPDLVGTAIASGLTLLIAAVVGKFVGAGLPAYYLGGTRTGLLVGISMIPRAEIMLIVMKRGLDMGSWAVSESLYGSSVIVAIGTCLIGTIWLRQELESNPDNSIPMPEG